MTNDGFMLRMTKDPMTNDASESEALVLAILDDADFLTIEQLVQRVPQLTWNQLFHIIDDLSRREAIVLRRRGFDYEIAAGPRGPARQS
jgi:hypothetical protein